MKTYIKVGGQEYEARVRLKSVDTDFGCRQTATVQMELPADQVKALFSEPGAWQYVKKDDTETVVKAEDYGDYELLLQIRDLLDGRVAAVLGKARPEEVLQILLGGDGNA